MSQAPQSASPVASILQVPVRRASVERNTKETRISANVLLDGTGVYDVKTGIGFLDHMLEQLSRHSLIDLTLRAAGMWWAKRLAVPWANGWASSDMGMRSSRWMRH